MARKTRLHDRTGGGGATQKCLGNFDGLPKQYIGRVLGAVQHPHLSSYPLPLLSLSQTDAGVQGQQARRVAEDPDRIEVHFDNLGKTDEQPGQGRDGLGQGLQVLSLIHI